MTREFDIPRLAKRGVPIEPANPYAEIRKHVEKASDWEFKDEAAYLYDKAVLLRERLLDPIARLDRARLPDPIIGFKDLRNHLVLAEYLLVRDDLGLTTRINFNKQHHADETTEEGQERKVWRFGRWAQLETLLHEYTHLWQQTFGQDPVRPGKVYHSKEFVEKCESMGLHPKLSEGYHLRVATEPFSILMKELGIEPPADVPKLPRELGRSWFEELLKLYGEERKGTSTLTKWVCPECGLKTHIGIKGNPELVHDPCSEKKGEKVFLVRGDVYSAKKD